MTNECPGNLLKNDSNQPLTFLRIRVAGVRSEEGETRRQTSRAAATSRRAVNCFTV